MTKVIRQFRNKSKALELKLEQEEMNRYQITLAGITVNVNACANGACGDNHFTDTETYIHQTFPDLQLAEQVYANYKTLYLD